MWSTHTRRIDPISRSAKPFCQGEAGAVGFPCVHAAANTPVQQLGAFFAQLAQLFQPSPIWQSGRPAHRPFRDAMGAAARKLHTSSLM
jgi:hypothetical protein